LTRLCLLPQLSKPIFNNDDDRWRRAALRCRLRFEHEESAITGRHIIRAAHRASQEVRGSIKQLDPGAQEEIAWTGGLRGPHRWIGARMHIEQLSRVFRQARKQAAAI